jgi:hypothetical protein
MSWVIWVEIHDYIGMSPAMDNKAFFIAHGWDFTEGARDFISF